MHRNLLTATYLRQPIYGNLSTATYLRQPVRGYVGARGCMCMCDPKSKIRKSGNPEIQNPKSKIQNPPKFIQAEILAHPPKSSNPNPIKSKSDQIQIRSNPNPIKSKSDQIQIRSNPNPIKSGQIRSNPVKTAKIRSNPVKSKPKSAKIENYFTL
jgi:hypothetical protein